MIAAALRLEIERYAQRMPQGNPLYTKAAEGALTPDHLRRYLASVHLLIQHTPIHLRRAIQRAERLGQTELAAHFAEKIHEEVGHDAWAERDLARVGKRVSRGPAGPVPARAMHDQIAFIESTIDEDPALYLAYILFAEYLIVLLGPSWLDLLERRCGIPRSEMTVIANHAELDKEHADEALQTIDDLVGDPAKLARMRRVVQDSIVHFERVCHEVTLDAPSERADRDAAVQAPAA